MDNGMLGTEMDLKNDTGIATWEKYKRTKEA